MSSSAARERPRDGARKQGVEAGTGHLSKGVIVDACIELADREGLGAVTLRRLGAELGADPTAVYRHFRDKGELLTAVADRLLGSVLAGYRPSGNWRQDVREVVLGARRMYLAHPALAHVVATSPAPLTNNQRLAETVFGGLRSAGLDDPVAARAGEVIENYAAGASSLDAVVGSDVDTAWRTSFAMLPPEEFPNAVAVAPHLYRDDEASFTFGLELILDGLERLASRPEPPSGPTTEQGGRR